MAEDTAAPALPPIFCVLVEAGEYETRTEKRETSPAGTKVTTEIERQPKYTLWQLGGVFPSTDQVQAIDASGNPIPGTEGSQAAKIVAMQNGRMVDDEIVQDGSVTVFGSHIDGSEMHKRGLDLVLVLSPSIIKNVSYLAPPALCRALLDDMRNPPEDDDGEDDGDDDVLSPAAPAANGTNGAPAPLNTEGAS